MDRGGNLVGGQILKCLEELKYIYILYILIFMSWSLRRKFEENRKHVSCTSHNFKVQIKTYSPCTLSFSHSAAHPLLLRYRWSQVILGGVLQSWRRWRRWLHLWRLSGRWLCRFPDSLRWWRVCSRLTYWHMQKEAEKLTRRQPAFDLSSVC